MDRYAILVDAGYFYAAGAHAIHSKPVPRRSISLASPEKAVKALCEKAAQVSGIPSLLRVYWYDAILGPRPSLEQTTLAKMSGVKMRLGSLNSQGEQKGVDSLMVTDLIEIARNRALSDAVLVSGDEDLRVAVQVAQTFGVRVHILAVGDAVTNVSHLLQMEADSVDTLDTAWIKTHFSFSLPQAPAVPASNAKAPGKPLAGSLSANTPEAPAAASSVTFEDAASKICNELLAAVQGANVEALRVYFESNKTVPPEYDRKLIAKTGVELGRFLTAEEKRRLRGIFVGHVRKIAGTKPS